MVEFLECSERVPFWLKENIPTTCPCGAKLVVNENLTRMFCINALCYKHIAQRGVWLAKELGAIGFGTAAVEGIVRANNLKSHIELIPYFTNEKPRVYLWQAVRYIALYGLKDKLESILGNCSTIDEYFAKNPVADPILLDNYDYIKMCLEYFDIKPVAPVNNVINVWLTGSIPGYSNRNDFIARCNELYGDKIKVRDNKKKQSGTSFLIKTPSAADRSKSEDAARLGIPIITPEDFMDYLDELYQTLKF